MKTMQDVFDWVKVHIEHCSKHGFPSTVNDINSYATGLCEGYASALKEYVGLEIPKDDPDINVIEE